MRRPRFSPRVEYGLPLLATIVVALVAAGVATFSADAETDHVAKVVAAVAATGFLFALTRAAKVARAMASRKVKSWGWGR